MTERARDLVDLPPLDVDDPPPEVDEHILGLARRHADENLLRRRLVSALNEGEEGRFGPILEALDEDPPPRVDRHVIDDAAGAQVVPLKQPWKWVAGLAAVAASLAIGSLTLQQTSGQRGIDIVAEAPQPPPMRTLQKIEAKKRKAAAPVETRMAHAEQAKDLADESGLEADGFDARAATTLVHRNRHTIAGCAKKGGSTERKIEIEIQLLPTGRVGKVAILTKRLEKTELAKCVVKQVKGWRFPAFDGRPQTLRMPIVLDPASR